MAPKTRASAKSKRVAQVATANARLHGRRGALRVLSGVVTSLQFESLCVNVKEQGAIPMLKLFRFFARRSFAAPIAQRCREAVIAFTENGGKLPEGLALSEDGTGLPMSADAFPVVPSHKVLTSSFRLHSRASMATYNSAAFTADSWADFQGWVDMFAGAHGAKTWAACLNKFESSIFTTM